MGLFTADRMSVEEAMAQLRDQTLQDAAMVAYKFAEIEKGQCESCALAIGDAIRSMMRAQR